MISHKAILLRVSLLFTLLFFLKGNSQTTVTIGNTNTSYNSEKYPFDGYYNYSWSNMLYLQSEVGSAGQITQVAFYITNSPSSYVMNSQKIYVRHTTSSSFSNSNYPGTSGFTLVYDGTITYSGSGWKTISLTTPFTYDGSSNLEFLFENRDGTWANGFPYFAYTPSSGSNRIRRDYYDGSFPSSCANCSALNNILNIQLTKQCSGSMTITPSSASICSGNNTSLSASGMSTYTWSPSTGLNATTGSSVVASPSVSTNYTVNGTDANGCVQSKTVSVTVNNVNISISPSTASFCAGQNISLTAAGATSYTWSPSTGLNSTSSPTVLANPSTTTTYTILGTGTGSCVSSRTIQVSVVPVSTITVTPANLNLCNNGSGSVTASGASTYTWSPSNGVDNPNAASVNLNPTASTIYTVSGSTSGCTSTAQVTVNVNNINAGTALASGNGNPCSNSQVSLSMDSHASNIIGNGTSVSENYPFNGYYDYSWSNVIYTQSELGAAGTISKIAFYVGNSPSAYTMNNQIIYMKHTSASAFSNNTYGGTSGYTQVFNGTITYNGSGWKEITLSTPFSYNGTDNLDVLFENRDGSWASGFPSFNYTSVSGNRVKRDYQDNSFPSSCNSCGAFAYVPNTTFTIDRPLGTFVNWQKSTDNINFTDISSATSTNYTTQVNNSTWFRGKFTNGNCTAFSSSVYYVTSNNYYVNDNSTSGDIYTTAIGSASNDGKDPARPKSSVNDIINAYTLSSCDTIFVDKGNYSEEINLSSADAGNSQGYIVIYGAGIDQSVMTAPSGKNNVSMYLTHHINISNFTFNSSQSSTYNNIKILDSEFNQIYNNKFSHSSGSNILVEGNTSSGNSNYVTSNIITNSSTSGYGIYIHGNTDYISVSSNTITMTNSSSLAGICVASYYYGGVNYFPSQGHIEQNSITAQNYGVKLYGPDYPISTYTINNNNITINTKSLTDGSALWFGSVGASSSEQSLVYNNRLIGGTNGIYLDTYADNLKIYNNYISGSDNGLYASASSSDVGEVYYNSFYNTMNNLYFAYSSAAYWKIKNNILYNTNSSASNACVRIGNTGVTFVACNNNLYYAPNGASFGRYSSTNYSTLSSWQNLDHADETPKGDENSLAGDPLYVNAASNNLDVSSASPGAGHATVINGITTDIYNNNRSSSPYIGAYETVLSLLMSSTQTVTCANPTVTISGTVNINNAIYSWVGPTSGTPAGSTPTASSTAVSSAGIYTLIITNPGNSSSLSGTVSVTSNTAIPNVSAGPNMEITPSTQTVTLSGSSSTSGVSYSWTPGGSSATTATTNVTAGGIYTLTVTDPSNGCKNSDTVMVKAKLMAIAEITDYSNDSLMGMVHLVITGGAPKYNVAWNGAKLPDPVTAYQNVKNTYPALILDSLKFTHDMDSIRQQTTFGQLTPGQYSVTVYDQNNDSVSMVVSIASVINQWAFVYGATTSTCQIPDRKINGNNFYYGNGQCLTQQGSFSQGNHFTVPLNEININSKSEISFEIPDNSKILSVGLMEKKAELNGDELDIASNTMLKFNGNGTYSIVFQNQTISSGNFNSGDLFSIKTNDQNIMSYYKNESLIYSINSIPLNSISSSFYPKVVFGSSAASISAFRVGIPFSLTPKVTGQITDVSCDNICSGNINAQGYFPLANVPVSYQLFNLGNSSPLTTIPISANTTVNFANLCPGKYTVNYNVNIISFHIIIGGNPFPSITQTPASVSQNFEVAYYPNWTNVTSDVAVTSVDHSLTKTGSVIIPSGAFSFNKLSHTSTNTEWYEWTSSNGLNVSGISSSDPDQNWNSINYGIATINLSGINIYFTVNNGSIINSGTYNPADKFKIEKNAGIIKMFKNNVQIGSSIPTVTNIDNYVDVSMYFQNGDIIKPRVSFGCDFPDVYAVLKKELDGTFFQTYNNKLLFTLDGDYSNTGIVYNVFNYSRSVMPGLTLSSSVLKNGDNRYLLDILSIPSGFYVLEIINQKNEKLVLRFKK